MGLQDLSGLSAVLACPRCRSSVEEDAEGFRCTSDSCALSANASFPRIEGWPVLVDFERSAFELPSDGDRQIAEPGKSRWSIERVPPTLRRFWKPRNRVAARNIETLLAASGSAPLILVVGGATVGNGIEAIYEERRTKVLAFDIQGTPHVQFIADAQEIPLADHAVDAVVVQGVLSQVLDPVRVVAEIHRVLRPEGVVYSETPFLQPVKGGAYDFTRYSGSGHRYLFRGFEEIAAGPVAGPGDAMLTSIDHLIRALLRSDLAGKLARGLFFWLRYLDRLIPESFGMDQASVYYFLGRRAEHEMSASEIVAYYRGAQRNGG